MEKQGEEYRQNVILVRMEEILGHFKFKILFNANMLHWQHNLVSVILPQPADGGCIPYPLTYQIKYKI